MLIDPHVHTSGVSPCCRMDHREILDEAKRIGLDGVAITNHYHKPYIGDEDLTHFANRFVKEFEDALAYGKEIGMKVFFGVEVSTRRYGNAHVLVYGITPDFIYDNPEMYDYTQEELYLAAKKAGGAVVQAHPFRNGAEMFDPRFIDGIEINCHPLYKSSYAGLLIDLAKRHGLALICGGDFHADSYRPRCGTYFPDETACDRDLADYILTSRCTRMLVQEPNVDSSDIARQDMIYELSFERS